jgi:tetratricopeptide (TPR) repeat protein
MVQSLNALGRITKVQEDYAAAQQFFSEATGINRELGDTSGLAISLMEMGSAAFAHQDYPTARACLEEALVINRKLGNKHDIALALSRLDETARKQGDYGAARAFYEEALTEFGELNPAGAISALNDLGCECLSKGDAYQAVSLFQEALTLALERGDRYGILLNLLGLARTFAISGKANHPRQAAYLFGQAETLLETTAQALDVGTQKERDRSLAMLRERLGDAEFQSLLTEGKTMPLEQAVAAAQSQW